MYFIWELLIGKVASESFSKVAKSLIKSGKRPQEEAIDKIFDDHHLLKKEEYNGVRTAVKEALNYKIEDKLSPDKTKRKFEYLCHQASPDEIKKIELACREVLEKFEIALKTIVGDPNYEILKILMETHLPEIECILKKNEITDPELFRESPTWVDFEKGYFVKREKQIKKVLQALETHNIHVIYGVPTSGKSNFVKYLGFELAKRSCVFYIGLKEHDIAQLFEGIKKIINKRECVLIIDDAHLNLKEVQTLIDIAKNKVLKLIIATRPLSDELYKTHTSGRVQKYIKDKKYSTELSPEEILDGLIDKYVEKNHMKIPPHVRSEIKKKYGKDLWILYWALKSYKENTIITKNYIYKEIAKERFYKYEYEHDHYLENIGEIFYYISLFSQYEFAVEKSFISDKIGKENLDKFEKLSKSREFIETGTNKIMLYHSSVANIYPEALYSGVYSEFIPKKEDEIEIFREYIEKYPEKGIKFIVYNILTNPKEHDLIKKIMLEIESEKIEEAINRSNDLYIIGNFIFWFLVLTGREITISIDTKKFINKMENSNEIRAMGYITSLILAEEIFRVARKEEIEEIFRIIGKKIYESDDLYEVCACLSFILETDSIAWKKLLGMAVKKIDQSKRLSSIGGFIYCVLDISPSFAKKLVNTINIRKIKEKLLETANKEDIKDSVGAIINADRYVAKKLIFILEGKIAKSSDVGGIIAYCTRLLLEIEGDYNRNLVEIVSNKIIQTDDLEAIGDFFDGISGLGIRQIADKFGKEVLKKIDINILADKIERFGNIAMIGYCISVIADYDPEIGKGLIPKIAKKINSGIPQDGIKRCVEYIENSNRELGELLISLINRNDIDFSEIVSRWHLSF